MKLSYVLIAVVLVIAGIYFVAQRSGAMEITQKGDELSISIGYYRLQAVKASDEYSDSMLVVGGMEPNRHLFFTTLIAVIPLDQAEALADAATEKPSEGEVLATGNGKLMSNGKIVPLEVKTGDQVLYAKYAGTKIKVENEELLVMHESDIMAVLAD